MTAEEAERLTVEIGDQVIELAGGDEKGAGALALCIFHYVCHKNGLKVPKGFNLAEFIDQEVMSGTAN